ncbi:hypothetical protein B0H15DRAFT_956626 [Mycena belliarum]|uniref:Uncharacterized protein n=1 Tax=Mycena belliarum TaxID=1033014 RepID=A0AAD6TP41_9AGAR|nr:hypothetical protein B0H15DRAFT_956626 [Mycena belliae]
MYRAELPAAPRQCMGHVNMMADTVLVNASPEDLRAILRSMLASKTPGLVSAFLASTHARLRLDQRRTIGPYTLPFLSPDSDALTPQVLESLTRARLLYGSGLGFASLTPLTAIVRSTIGHRWEAEGEIAHALVVIDADIAQALQSCRDELLGSQSPEYSVGTTAMAELATALETSRLDVERWGGEFPFERAVYSVLDFKL